MKYFSLSETSFVNLEEFCRKLIICNPKTVRNTRPLIHLKNENKLKMYLNVYNKIPHLAVEQMSFSASITHSSLALMHVDISLNGLFCLLHWNMNGQWPLELVICMAQHNKYNIKHSLAYYLKCYNNNHSYHQFQFSLQIAQLNRSWSY